MSEIFTEEFWTFLIGMFAYKGTAYGLQFDRNEVFKIDEENGLIPCGRAGVNSYDTHKLFHRVSVWGNKAYFIPFMSDVLYIYDFETKKFEHIPIQIDETKKVDGEGLFLDCIFIRNSIYLLPFSYRKIVIINLETKSQKEIDLENELGKETDKYLIQKGHLWMNEKELLVPLLSSNKCILLDTESDTCRILEVGLKKYKYGTAIEYGGKKYILAKNYLRLFEIDESYRVNSLHFVEELADRDLELRTFFDPESFVEYKGKFYCFPARWNHAICIDPVLEKVRFIESLENYCNSDRLNKEIGVFDGAVRIEDCLYLHYQLDLILKFNLETWEVKEISRKIYDPDAVRLKGFIEMVVSGENHPDELDSRIFSE
jgi:hypothetical protein